MENTMKKKIAVMCLCGALILSFAACSGESDKNTSDSSITSATETPEAEISATETPAAENASLGMGDTGEAAGVSVTLNSITETTGSDLIKPSDGNVFILCNFTIQNNSDTDLTISSMLCFEAYCDDASISLDLMGLSTDEAKQAGQLDGDVAVGKNLSGVVVYQVPSDYSKIEISVKPNPLNDETVDFEVTK